MKQVVDLGYAIDNGEIGKLYAIRIKRIADNNGNNLPQSLDPLGIAPGNKSGNNLVTTDGTNPKNFTEQAFRIGNNFGNPLNNSDIGVTKEHCSRNSSNGKVASKSSVDLLPSVTCIVTTPNPSPDKESTGFCYPVTDAVLQVGDRVILTGDGNSRPSDELKAVWSVQAIQGQKATVECGILEHRVFPLMWLTLYERATE